MERGMREGGGGERDGERGGMEGVERGMRDGGGGERDEGWRGWREG